MKFKCWIYRDDVQCKNFSVDIGKNKTVEDLKIVIRSKIPEFPDVKAKDLELYSIRIPRDDDEHLKVELKQVSLEDKLRLGAPTKVFKLFPEPDEGKEERLILVDGLNSGSSTTEPPVAVVSGMTLNCWVRGETTNRVFSTQISGTETVGGLRKVIKNGNPVGFRDVDLRDLVLYKVSLPYDDSLEGALADLTISDLRNPLRDSWKLSAVFMPLPADDQLHLIINIAVVPDMTFNCRVRGDTTGSVFPVEILSTKTVLALKEVIRNKKPACFRDEDDLDLYQVSFPYDDSLEGALANLTISGLGTPLPDKQKLSAVFVRFPILPNNQLHLVVEGMMPLDCWIRGTKPENSFRVRISMKACVNDLKNAIKATHARFKDLPPDCLNFFKIEAVEELALKEILDTRGLGKLLGKGNELLGEIFNDVPFSQIPCVVIQEVDENTQTWGHSPSTYHHIGNDDPILMGRKSFLSSDPRSNPSATGTPSSFRTRQLDPEHGKSIPCGRPLEYEETNPPTLLHPVFGQFVDDCQNIKVTAEDNSFVRRLAIAMSKLYAAEVDRVREVSKEFQSYGIHFNPSQDTGYQTDGDISVNGHRYVIAEFKNEISGGSAEPYFQAIEYYLESTRDSALKFVRSPLPCLLLAVYGSHIEFAGAAWNLHPTAQVLSTPIALHFHSTDTHNQLTVARHMVALHKATQTLKQYYENLQPPTRLSTSAPPPHMFYLKALDPASGKPIFLGTETDNGGRTIHICIKFVQSYCPAAHEHFASLECAPILRGYETIAGGWSMVVMDMLDGFEMLNTRTRPLPSSVFTDMSAKLKSFHEAHFVHGDIRDANIMVRKSGKTQFMIIDFDWAGVAGEAQYPAGVNYTDIERPAEARDGKEILADHDEFMLKRIAQRWSNLKN